jgi:hypothetical protein
MFQRNIVGISAQISLPKAEEKYQNVSVGDEVFALHLHAMNPYSKQFLMKKNETHSQQNSKL